VPTQQGINISYNLLTDFGVAYAYSHLVVASKFPMLPFATRKGYQRFCVSPRIKESLVIVVEDR
jgi:hypothetical protein